MDSRLLALEPCIKVIRFFFHYFKDHIHWQVKEWPANVFVHVFFLCLVMEGLMCSVHKMFSYSVGKLFRKVPPLPPLFTFKTSKIHPKYFEYCLTHLSKKPLLVQCIEVCFQNDLYWCQSFFFLNITLAFARAYTGWHSIYDIGHLRNRYIDTSYIVDIWITKL